MQRSNSDDVVAAVADDALSGEAVPSSAPPLIEPQDTLEVDPAIDEKETTVATKRVVAAVDPDELDISIGETEFEDAPTMPLQSRFESRVFKHDEVQVYQSYWLP